MGRYLISNCALIDGTGAAPKKDSAILVEGAKISAVGGTKEIRQKAERAGKCEVIDAGGKTVMPGLIEGHCHLNFFAPKTTLDIDSKWPAQFMGMAAMSNAQKLLAAGYTSAVSGGAQFTVDVWVKRAIGMGLFRGPRLLAASRPITTTGGDGDWHPSWQKVGFEPMSYTADGPEEILKAARLLLKEGPDALKIFTSGEGGRVADYHPQMYDCSQHRETMLPDEIQVAVDETHRWDRVVIAHTRDTQSIKNCIKAGVDIILHVTYIDDEGIEMMTKSPPLAVVPALMPPKKFIAAYHEGKISQEYYDASDYGNDWTFGTTAIKRLHDLGIRVIPGGEYGLGGMPFHGENAQDLQLFVDDVGLTPMQTISAATRDAAHLFRMEKELGTLEPNKIADLLIVDGDPSFDIAILQDQKRISVVMQSGEIQAREGKLLPL
jgi:imidazolonepropionase-like amidohydrolase